jgi:putative endonuclease
MYAESSNVAFVYLLRCADDTLYCGWTVDVPKRLNAHATGRASRYTAARRPHALAAAWKVPTHTDARKLEARIKQLTRPEKLALVSGAPIDGATPVRFASLAP